MKTNRKSKYGRLVITKPLENEFKDTIARTQKFEKGIILKCTEQAIKAWILNQRRLVNESL